MNPNNQAVPVNFRSRNKVRANIIALVLAVTLYLLQISRAKAEDHVDYRYENYKEDAGRIVVETHSALFDTRIKPWVSLRGEFVYDAISGASPTGGPPPSQVTFAVPVIGPLSTKVPVASLNPPDARFAGVIEPTFTLGASRISPQFSYSEEHDYISYGASLNYSVDVNEKNTTLNWGVAHSWDKILLFGNPRQNKEAADFLLGVTQIIDSKTLLTVNFSYGRAQGYLNDQYKGVLFRDYPQTDPNNLALYHENRPHERDKLIAYTSLTHAFTSLHGSLEGSYRFYHDTYDINAHTVGLSWLQNLGKNVVVSPQFRYYHQSAAEFYAVSFAGDIPPFNPSAPANFSSDYRLSKLQSFTAGISVSAKVTDSFTVDLGYKRYWMEGLDHVTSSSAYPAADVITLGCRLWF